MYPRDHGAVESGTPSGAGRWASSPPRGLYPLRVPPGEGAVKIFSSYAKQYVVPELCFKPSKNFERF